MEWTEIDNSIISLEKAYAESLANIENMELLSQVSLAVDDENTNILRQMDILNKEKSSLKSKLEENSERNASLKRSLEALMEEVAENERKCTEIKSSIEMKPSDNLRMVLARETLNVGKEFTGIRWDFTVPNDIAKGYIANKERKLLEPFQFDKNVLSEEVIQSNLWKLIEAKSTVDWNDLIKLCSAGEVHTNKENIQTN